MNKRLVIFSTIYALIFSIFIYIGCLAEEFDSISFFPARIEIFFISFLIAFSFFFFADKLHISRRNFSKTTKFTPAINIITRRPIIIGQVLMLLFWFPSFLALYPGLFIYDATSQYGMVVNKTIDMHHPLIHTYLIAATVRSGELLFGSINKGVMLYSLVQMIIVSLILSFALSFLVKQKHYVIWCFSVLWFSFYSPIVLHVFAVTKDTIFSALCIAFLVLSIELLKKETLIVDSKRTLLLWALFMFLCCIFRNNAVYALFMYSIIFLCRVKGRSRRNVLICLLFTFVIFAVYNGPFAKAISTAGVNSQEYLSVPSQQMVGTYKKEYDKLNESQKELVETLFDEVAITYYNPRIADITKWRFNRNVFRQDPKKYITEYFSLGKEYPLDYINSIILNTYGFWYPFSTLVLDLSGTTGYGIVDCKPPAVLNSHNIYLLSFYKLFENSELVQGNKATMWFFEPAMFFWLLLFCIMYSIYKRVPYVSIAFIFPLLLWGTYLLGPVVLVRYNLFLYMALPFEISAIVDVRSTKM